MNNLNMWYEYEWAFMGANNEELNGHYETENPIEIINRMLTTFSDMINGFCKVKMLEEKTIDGEHYCNLYVKYNTGKVKTAKFGNVPIEWGGQINARKLYTMFFEK